MSLEDGDFDYVRTLLRKQSGMVIEPGKEYLVKTRLTPIAKQAGCASLSNLITQLRGRAFDQLHMKVVEALMINETQFFRDTHPFTALESKILPELLRKRASVRQLKLWCAAASTGQEPYSVAMLLAESFPELASWDVQFIASDISEDAIERARQGEYRQLDVDRGLPAPMLVKYFCQHGSHWQITEQLRQRLEFRKINLVQQWPSLPPMDIVLMRNVLIYLDVDTKKAILAKLRQLLKPDGYLFLGSTETTINLDPSFEQVQIDRTVCYRLRR